MITNKQIEQLQIEAGAHGDQEQVALCAAARDGDSDARAECERVMVLAVLADYVHDPLEHEIEPDVFRVAWEDDGSDETGEICVEIQRQLPRGWTCDWTGDGNTDSDGTTTSDFRVERMS